MLAASFEEEAVDTSLWLTRPPSSSRKGGIVLLGANEQCSEVTRLLSQISAEYEAAQRGLSGQAAGTSQHEFITARMQNIGQCQQQLQGLVGQKLALALVTQQLNQQTT